MADPLGLIGIGGGMRPAVRPSELGKTTGPLRSDGEIDSKNSDAPDFKEMLLNQLKEVNDLGREATQATEDLLAGKRKDFETVLLATRKADMATQMLLQLRNKVMTAYDEVKQIRV